MKPEFLSGLSSPLFIREPLLTDEALFIAAMNRSQTLHHPWVKAPTSVQEFHSYVQRSQQSNQKCFLLLINMNILSAFLI